MCTAHHTQLIFYVYCTTYHPTQLFHAFKSEFSRSILRLKQHCSYLVCTCKFRSCLWASANSLLTFLIYSISFWSSSRAAAPTHYISIVEQPNPFIADVHSTRIQLLAVWHSAGHKCEVLVVTFQFVQLFSLPFQSALYLPCQQLHEHSLAQETDSNWYKQRARDYTCT